MKLFLSFVIMITAIGVTAFAGDPTKLAFTNGKALYLFATPDSHEAKKIADGEGELSPDGTRAAYIKVAKAKNGLTIAVLDLGNGQSKEFESMPSSSSIRIPRWSPDGTKLLVEFSKNDRLDHVGLINADGSNFHMLPRPGANQASLSAGWGPNGDTIFCQDEHNHLYEVGMDGKVVKTWAIDKLIPHGSLTEGRYRLALSPDGKTLLLNVDMVGEKGDAAWGEGPPSSIWMINLADEKATRLTPPGVNADDACWWGNSAIVCRVQFPGEKDGALCRISLADGAKQAEPLKVVGQSPSAAP